MKHFVVKDNKTNVILFEYFSKNCPSLSNEISNLETGIHYTITQVFFPISLYTSIFGRKYMKNTIIQLYVEELRSNVKN